MVSRPAFHPEPESPMNAPKVDLTAAERRLLTRPRRRWWLVNPKNPPLFVWPW